VSDGDAVQVTREGIALVHYGEIISAAPDAEAAGEPYDDPDRVVHYHFPVHVEVHVHGRDAIEEAIERRLGVLAASFESL
jgi:hypothetical protein